jgi:branched-chain amino acid transport system substrate-binding protein
MTKSFKAAVEKTGGKVVATDGSPFPNQTGDFSNLLIKASNAKPEVLGAMQAGGDLVNVVKQFNQFKLKDQKITLAIGLLFDTDIAALGPDAFAGVVYTTPWLWTMDDQARSFGDKFKAKTGVRPTFAHAGNYSAAWQYLDAVRRAGTDDADKVVAQLEGFKFSDFFIRNGQIRPEDHWVMHDALLAQVKPASEVKEPGDYSKVLGTLKAADVSRPVAEANCKK